MRFTSHITYGGPNRVPGNLQPTGVTQSFLYNRPFLQILADGTVRVAPSVSTDEPAHVQRMLMWVLRREAPEKRALILKALEGNRTGVDVPALCEGLRLSLQQMDRLRVGSGNSRWHQLSAEQPPWSSSPRAVVEILQQEVQRMHKYLSMRDVLTLAKFAAHEIERRSTGEQIPDEYQALHLYRSLAMSDCFKGRTLDDDPVLKCEMGPIERQVGDQLAKAHDARAPLLKANDALAPLLNASARWLDKLLQTANGALLSPEQEQEQEKEKELSQEQKKELARERKKKLAEVLTVTYDTLLAYSFSLGKDVPQCMHQLLQHHRHMALDKLKTKDRPEEELLARMQSAGEAAGPPDPSNKRKRKAEEQLNPPPVTERNIIEDSQQQARADALHVAATARAKLTGRFELQNGLRCLEHAYNNLCSNWLALHHPGMPFVRISLLDEAQELSSIDPYPGPDGRPMQRLRLLPQQLRALMPELEAHLDLAIVFKGPTNLTFGDLQVNQTHHYTALIKVKDVYFELESLATDPEAGKRWIPSLQAYLDSLQGGAYMAIRGGNHLLSKYVKLMAIEPFWKTCEALGVLVGKQPIIELANFLPGVGMEDTARQINAYYAAAFCRSGLRPNAMGHETNVPEEDGRSKAIVDWLDTLGTKEAILWTGTDPMVTAVARAASGEWLAFDSGSMLQRSLLEVLDEQQSLFKGLAPPERNKRAGFAQALTLVPPVVHAVSPALAQSAVRGVLPAAIVEVRTVPSPGEQAVAESQQILLRAFKDYKFYTQNHGAIKSLALDPAIKSGAQVIDRVLNGWLEDHQFETLLTMSRNWLRSDPPDLPASQHLSALYMVGGLAPKRDDLLVLLPFEVPPSLAPYTHLIQKNFLRWRSAREELGKAALAKLGIKPTIDLT